MITCSMQATGVAIEVLSAAKQVAPSQRLQQIIEPIKTQAIKVKRSLQVVSGGVYTPGRVTIVWAVFVSLPLYAMHNHTDNRAKAIPRDQY